MSHVAAQNVIFKTVEEIHSVGTINNVETSYFTQLKIGYLMTTFRCPSDFLITSWLFTARWNTWPGNHLFHCVAELVGSCIPIHAHRCLPDPKCLFYPSGLSLCLSVDHFCLVPVDNMDIFFIYLRAFNNNLVPTVNLIANYGWRPVYIAASTEYLRRIQIILCC